LSFLSGSISNGWKAFDLSAKASMEGTRVVARRAPLDRHQPHRRRAVPSRRPSSSKRRRRLLAASSQTPAARSAYRTPTPEADRKRRRLPTQADALSTRSKRSNVGQRRCVPLPRLCPLLWLAFLLRASLPLKYPSSLDLLLGGVRLLTGRHAGEGCGSRGREKSWRAEVGAGSSDPVAGRNTQLGDC
jgi:hypothetical protein